MCLDIKRCRINVNNKFSFLSLKQSFTFLLSVKTGIFFFCEVHLQMQLGATVGI